MDVVRVIAKLEPGGAQLSALRLSHALPAYGVRTVRFLAGEATTEGVELARRFGTRVDVFSPPIGLQWQASAAFAAWLAPRLRGAELVHAHMFGAWWATAQALPASTPLVASEHNEMTWPGKAEDAVAGLLAATHAAPRIDAFFAHGPAARDFALGIGIPVERLREGRSAIAGPREGREDRRGRALREPRITFTGRLTHDKGPDVLIEALGLLPRSPTTYVVGAGALRGKLQSRARALGLTRLVRFPGWSYAPGRYVAGAAVHVVPSREEAWSQSAVTALSLGVPVVGTAVDGLRVTLGAGRGLLVPPDDPEALASALRRVLAGGRTDPEPGIAYASQFTPDAVARSYARCYHQLVPQVEFA